MSVWCSICGKYHDSTTGGCPCGSTTIYTSPPGHSSVSGIICPHCGKEIKIEVKE